MSRGLARGALYEWRPREGGDPELIVDRYLTQTGEFPGTPAVIDVASGRSTSLDIGQPNRALQMAWDLNGDVTVAVRPRAQDDAPVDLMTCDPTNGACVVVAEDVGKFSGVILAGETYAGL